MFQASWLWEFSWETDAYDWSTSEIFAARRACLENGSDVSSAAEIGH